MNVQPQIRVPPVPVMSAGRVGLIGAILVAIGPFSMALFTPAMPQIVTAFGTTEQMVKLTLTLYFAGFAFAQLVCGPLSDGFGRRPITIAFMGIYCVGSVGALLAPNIEFLIAARFVQGIGAAVGVAISRAVVRDLFTRDESARIMNLIGLILGIAPAAAPTIGGLTMELFGWHAIFILMFLAGVAIAVVVYTSLRETVVRDLSRIQPRALVRSYGTLFKSRYFMFSALVMGFGIGTAYTQATVMPFILMTRIGLTPSQYGFGMLMQSGCFFAGNLAVRYLLRQVHAATLVPVGLCFTFTGATSLAYMLHFQELTFLHVMVPCAFLSFGMAFIMPAMSTATMAPFPHIAGSASALAGFIQMGAGLFGSLAIAACTDPVWALGTIVPGMGYVAILSWFLWRRLPEPALAGIKTSVVVPDAPHS